jgi:hypothetical protein
MSRLLSLFREVLLLPVDRSEQLLHRLLALGGDRDLVATAVGGGAVAFDQAALL